MSLRLKLVLAFAAVASVLVAVAVSSFFTSRRVESQVADLRARHDVDLSRLDYQEVSLEIEGFWDPSGAFVATDIDAKPGRRRPKLRGPLQKVDAAAGSLTLFGIEMLLTPQTEVSTVEGAPVSLADLTVGDRVEVKAEIGDGVWHLRSVETGGVKHNDKIKATPTALEIDGQSPETLAVHDLLVLLDAYNADSPESALHRIRVASQLALVVQGCRASAQEFVGRHLAARPVRPSAGADDEDDLPPASAAERVQRCGGDFAHYLEQSRAPGGEPEALPGVFARRLHELAEAHVTLDRHLATFQRQAEDDPLEAQRFLDSVLDPFLSHELLPLVFAYRSESEEALEAQVRSISTSIASTTRVTLVSSAAAFLLAIALGVLIWRSIHVPIRDLAGAALRLGAGKLDTRVDVRNQDELGLLASAFNQMAIQIATSTVSLSSLENIFDSMAGGLVICDSEGLVTRINGATEALLGYQPDELLDRPFASLCRAEDKHLVPLAPDLPRDVSRAAEMSLHRKDGTLLPVSLTVAELRDEAGPAQGYVYVIQDLTERKCIEERLLDSLAEKELLLGEIHHRVKNNLQVVSSLLEMQSSSTQDPEILAQFTQSQNRIRSMALIHEQLCETSLTAAVDLREYLSRLVEGLMHSFDQEPIAFELDLDACTCGIDDALTCGLITNELVTNSIKHAFEGPAGGRIVVSLRSSEGTRILVVADDGRGLAVDIGGASSLGLSLVKTLVRQLRGELQVLEGPGTRIEIRFPADTPTGDAAA